MNYKKAFIVFIIITISFIPLLDLFHHGLPQTHDGQDHVARIANFYQNLSEGNIIPRWAGNLNWGYGHPILMFLYPLPSYSASLFHFLGFSLIDSTKIVFGMAFLLSGLTMYLWIKNILGIYAGVVAGILYMFAPYRFVDLHVRGAIGEHVAFIFPPLICYFIYKLSKKYSHFFVVGGGLSVAGLLLSHNAISLMFFPIIFLYALYVLWRSNNKIPLAINYFLFAALGFGLSAFFWMPAFFEGKYTLRDIVTKGEYASRFVRLKQFFYGSWSFGGTGLFSVQLGIMHWVMIVGSIILLFFKKAVKEHKKLITGLLIIIAVALFLMISQSSILWQNITLLQKFQFPWRFLSVVVFSGAVLGALVVSAIPKNYKKYVIGIIILGTLFFSKDYVHAKGYLYKDDNFFGGIYYGTTDTGESSPIWSVRFMEKIPKGDMEVISGKASIKEISRKSTVHAYEINAVEKSRILENTLYFPGWSIIIDGKTVPIEFQDPNYRGLMTFYVPKGEHVVIASFGETKLRLFADTISVISVITILGFLGFERLKNKI